MTVTIDEAIDHLNITESEDQVEVELYVNAANEWVATKVADPSAYAVKLATLFLIQHLWNSSQRGPTAVAIDDEIVTVTGVGYAIPNRVRELLQPYLVQAAPAYSFPDAAYWPDAAERVTP